MPGIELHDVIWVGVVSVLHAMQLGQAATEVANLRRKNKINPPSIDGPPDFVRALRAQQNSLEFGVAFQIVLWSAGLFGHQVPAALLGLFYLYSRHRYIKGYIQDADKRIRPFWWGIWALEGLVVVAVAGLLNVGLKTYLNIDMAMAMRGLL